jgi:arylsulfatase A-like enzyme
MKTSLLSLTLGCILAAAVSAAAERPNVLFIISDDLNNYLGCYGDPLAKTPNIDALAARGVKFERAYCAFPLCGPSRNSILTGLYPNSNGILANSQVFRQTIPSHVSLPQAFRQAGYFAARIGKLYHYNVPNSIGTNGHDDPGSWELELNPAGIDRLEDQPKIITLTPGQYGGTLSWLASEHGDAEQTDGKMAADAEWVLERCAKQQKERPFFLALGFFRPHTPYVAPKEPYFGWYPGEKMRLFPSVDKNPPEVPAAALGSYKKEQDALTDDLRRDCAQAYYASISFMDAQVGRVIGALDRLGLADNTIVVFTSDHGYHMGEHGLYQKMSLFEGSARVPMLIVAPGAGKGTTVTEPVSQIDLYPTLTELAGVKAPGNLQGQSLVPMLKDYNAKGRGWAITQVSRGGGRNRATVTKDKSSDLPRFFGYSLRTPRWRYTEWDEEGKQGRELYDHDADPGELANLAGKPEHAATIAELSLTLRAAAKATFPADGKTPEIKEGGLWAPNLTDP